jgi:hypothetical protein
VIFDAADDSLKQAKISTRAEFSNNQPPNSFSLYFPFNSLFSFSSHFASPYYSIFCNGIALTELLRQVVAG